MGWPYQFLDLTDDDVSRRRILLDRYGVYAQLSAFIPILAFQLYRLWNWVYSERQSSRVAYSEVPSSPMQKHAHQALPGSLISKRRKVVWWLKGDVAKGWGSRGHCIAGGLWTAWLLFLSVHQTGQDYLHITKRFGIVAASQLPLHYALSMKSLYSPLAFVFRSSHEQLNSWHRLLGRIIHSLLLLHATWYLNFFIRKGILYQRMTAPVVIFGYVAFTMLNILASTSLEVVRRWSYRVFFVFHLLIGSLLMPLLFFHAKPLRIYAIEAIALFIFDLVCRRLDTMTGLATISIVPNTKLIQLKIPVPASKIGRFKQAPGQHVYLSIPPESVSVKKSSPSIHDLLFNPFSVASVSDKDITLVVRALHGPTTNAISALATLRKAKPPIKIEGPYGTPRKFPHLSSRYDRVLLVAGGVGATFILPIYRDLKEQFEAESKNPDHVAMVWSMRSGSEASWALDGDGDADSEGTSSVDSIKDIKIYITGGSAKDSTAAPEGGSVELENLQTRGEGPLHATTEQRRPDLGLIVDEVFRSGREERVAVLVCGPDSMARELRKRVGKWVDRGRDVWFYNESFGW